MDLTTLRHTGPAACKSKLSWQWSSNWWGKILPSNKSPVTDQGFFKTTHLSRSFMRLKAPVPMVVYRPMRCLMVKRQASWHNQQIIIVLRTKPNTGHFKPHCAGKRGANLQNVLRIYAKLEQSSTLVVPANAWPRVAVWLPILGTMSHRFSPDRAVTFDIGKAVATIEQSTM